MSARIPVYPDKPAKRFPRRIWVFFRPHPDQPGEFIVEVFTNKRKAFDFMSATKEGREMKLHVHEFG